MKRTRQEQEREIRSALEMLQRAKPGGATTAFGHDGPVDPHFAIGWAQMCLERALNLPANKVSGPPERERIEMCGPDPVRNEELGL